MLVQTLTRGSAIFAVEALNTAGWAAVRHGNLIEVASGVVGVEEACSGVRGLQTSLMVSLVLGELGRLSITRRFVLVLVGAVMALFLNLLRAIGLSALASQRGVAAVDDWHDTAGFAEYRRYSRRLAPRLLSVEAKGAFSSKQRNGSMRVLACRPISKHFYACSPCLHQRLGSDFGVVWTS